MLTVQVTIHGKVWGEQHFYLVSYLYWKTRAPVLFEHILNEDEPTNIYLNSNG